MGPATLALLALAAFGAGLVDAIGGGGGLITFPALVAAGLPPHLALGTNKGQAVFGAVSSAASFWHGRGLDPERAPIAFAFGFVGSCVGALGVLAVHARPLRPVIIVLLLAAATVLLLRGRLKVSTVTPRHPRLVLAGIGLGLGAYDGFFGPGVGSMLIVAFMLAFGDAITRASGNAKVVNLASNLAAVLVFATRGQVLWQAVAAMAVSNALGARLGARLALSRGDAFVRWVVLAVVAVAIAKLAVDFARGA